ncbi:hypothetical protein H6G04_32785 [Calothrix membranacea FACHB-236]|nr:hypothetical protein [Calothrix membranacea FACHB-236]
MQKHQILTRSLIALGFIAANAVLAPHVLAEQMYGTQDTEDKVLIMYYRSNWVKVQPKTSTTLSWSCPNNAYTVGGGFETRAEEDNVANGFTVVHSFPSSEHQWRVRLRNQDDIARDVRIYNICAE